MAPSPRVSIYKVKKGDTLWGIANEQYGDPTAWPEIKKANRLANGNLILIGQTLRLPSLPATSPVHSVQRRASAPSANHPPSEAALVAQQFLNPTFKINLTKDTKPIPILTLPPGWRGQIKLKGEVGFAEKGPSNLEVSSQDVELTPYRRNVSNKLNQLSSEAKIKFDPKRPEDGVALSWGLAVAAKMNGKVFATSKFERLMFPDPGWKYSYDAPEIHGEWDSFRFEGTFGYEVEIHPGKEDSPKAQVPAFSGGNVWFAVGIALPLLAFVLAQDIGTFGTTIPANALEFAAVFQLVGATTARLR